MSEYWGGGKCLLQRLEGSRAFFRPEKAGIFSCQPGHRGNDVAIAFYKASIKVCKSQEGLDIFHIPRYRPFLYSCDFGSIHFCTAGRYDESQVFYFLPMEFTFLWFQMKAGFRQCFQDFKDMVQVIIQVVTVDDDVVEVCSNKDIQVGSENIIDEVLETSWGIGQAERHYQRLKQPIPRPECCLPILSFGHSDKIVSTSDIQLRRILGLLQP
jgi:hypothetical protein